MKALKILLFTITTATTQASVMQVNLGKTGAVTTETGFTDWTHSGTGIPTATTINGIGLSIAIGNSNYVGLREQDRGATAYIGDLDNLTQTHWGTRAASGNGAQFSIIINGSDLGAGTFEWTGWHHDQGNQDGTMLIDFSVDAGLSYTVAESSFDIVDGLDAAAPNPATFEFTSDGTNDIHVRFTNNETSITTGNNWALINGFQIVPEPSSVTLLGLGGLALILRRRW